MHSFQNSLVNSAAADIAIHVTSDLRFAGIRTAFKQRNCGEDHARCAVAALKCFGLKKGLLYQMQTLASRQPFDGRDFLPRGGTHMHSARTDWRAFNQHCASATLAFAAAVLGPGEFKLLAQHAEQSVLWRDIHATFSAVDQQSEGHRVSASSLGRVFVRIGYRGWRIAGRKTVLDGSVEGLLVRVVLMVILVRLVMLWLRLRAFCF